jgi:predicted ATPase with chaperone activity
VRTAVSREPHGARTIADLAGEERIGTLRLAEALQHLAYESRRSGSA